MILTREDVKELTATGSLEVVLARLPAKPVQSVQVAVAKPAVCVVRVIDHWPHRSGQLVVVVELVKRNKPSPPRVKRRKDTVRLMKPGRGTTADPRSAMRSAAPTGPPDDDQGTPGVPHPNLSDCEPELVDEQTEMRFGQKARQSAELRWLDQQRREMSERMERVMESCHRLGVDPTRHVAALDRRLTELERELRKAERKKAA